MILKTYEKSGFWGKICQDLVRKVGILGTLWWVVTLVGCGLAVVGGWLAVVSGFLGEGGRLGKYPIRRRVLVAAAALDFRTDRPSPTKCSLPKVRSTLHRSFPFRYFLAGLGSLQLGTSFAFFHACSWRTRMFKHFVSIFWPDISTFWFAVLN